MQRKNVSILLWEDEKWCLNVLYKDSSKATINTCWNHTPIKTTVRTKTTTVFQPNSLSCMNNNMIIRWPINNEPVLQTISKLQIILIAVIWKHNNTTVSKTKLSSITARQNLLNKLILSEYETHNCFTVTWVNVC